MGFFKKITRPISRVLNKVIPNEIKPLLPYAAAFAPYMMPAGFGMGASTGLAGLLKRSALTGGLNLGSQLAQEGSEGDFSGISTLLAAAQGFGTGTGAEEYLSGLTTAGGTEATALGEVADKASMLNDVDAAGAALGSKADLLSNRSLLTKAKDLGLSGLAKTAGSLQNMSSTLQNPGINMETAKAALVPFTQGSGDLAMAAARNAMKDYEAELAAFNAQAGETQAGNDNARRSAITSSMLAANFAQDVIDSTLAQVGLKDGGRVGKMNGGIMNAKRGLVNAPGGYAGEGEEVEFGGITEAVENIKEDKQRAYMELLDTKSIDREADLRMERLNNLIEEGMSEDEAFKLVMPNAFSNDGKTDSEGRTIEIEINEKTDPIIKDYASYSKPRDLMESVPPQYRMNKDQYSEERDNQDTSIKERFMYGFDTPADKMINFFTSKAKGGIIGLNMGGSVLPQGIEMDYRGGGFIPMGSAERADDVDARVSKNEFVMTADAVRAAGGGSVNKGARKMYELMNNLEARA